MIVDETYEGVPFVVEAGFAVAPDRSRRLVHGVNFAPAIGNPFRSFDYSYDGLETRLAEHRCGRDEPVAVILHLVCAHTDYQDRGKTAIVLAAAIADAISAALDHVTGPWAKQRKAEERRADAETKRMARLSAKQEREAKAEKLQPEPTGVLGLRLAAEAEAIGVSFDSLTVLSRRRDPYNQWRWQADAQWFAEWFERLVGPDGKKHLRGVHYLLVMTMIESVQRPDGKPYRNDFKSWCWLQDAAKAARWLDYLDFERIIDERNAPPLLYVPGRSEMPIASSLSSGAHCEIPPLKSLLPDFELRGFTVQQPYRLVFYGEKSSLGPILEPLAKDLGTELILATGESSHTLVAGMTRRAIKDGRPTVVFYFSDFDPGGHQMPISVARQLQALRDLKYPELDIKLYPAALTLAQVRALNLPSKPLKETEQRADRWREAMGHEQTEIDALIEGYPDELRRIARDAVRPFYDFTLASRLRSAELAWWQENQARLEAHPGYARAETRIAAARKQVSIAVGKLRGAQNRAWRALKEVVSDPPELPLPKPNIEGVVPRALFDSKADFVEATKRLRAHRRYEEDEAEER